MQKAIENKVEEYAKSKGYYDEATKYWHFKKGANLLSPDLAQALELLEEVTKRYGIEWPDIETLLAKYKP